MEIEQLPQEARDHQEVLLPVWDLVCRFFGLMQAATDVVEVRAERSQALTRDGLADEIADQQPQERVTLDQREGRGRRGVFAERVKAVVSELPPRARLQRHSMRC